MHIFFNIKLTTGKDCLLTVTPNTYMLLEGCFVCETTGMGKTWLSFPRHLSCLWGLD